MNIEKLKQARSSRSWEMFVNSPTIREFAPDIKTVSVKVQMVILRQSISSRKIIRGKIYCTGKEDWKYLNASGCTCQTTLYYELAPNF